MKEKTAEKLHKKFKAAGIRTWIVEDFGIPTLLSNRHALMINGQIVTSANKAHAMLTKMLKP